MNYYFCDACHYCFTAEMHYRRIQMELNEEELRTAGKEAAGYESHSYSSHGTGLRQSHV